MSAPWLESIPPTWREVALQFLATIETGSKDTINAVDGGSFPFIVRSSEALAIDTFTYDTEAILTAGDGAVGEIFHHIKGKFDVHQRVYVIHNFRDIDGRYLYWYFSSEFRRTVAHGGAQTTVASLRRSMFTTFPVAVPPQGEQKAIADFLDRETEELDATIRKLDLLRGALEDRMRVVRTKIVFGLTGQHHSAADAHSPLSGIPEHWDRTKFGYDFTESSERNGDDPPGPLLSISASRGVELNSRAEGQQASLDVSKYRVVRPGQLAANMMWLNHGGLGVSSLIGYISPDYKAFWISDRFEPRYVHHLFRSSRYIDYFAAIATGVRPNAQRVTKTVLDATPVPLPPLDEQTRIADELDEATTRVISMLAKVADLKSLLLERRAALITDVVTGKKEVA